MMGFRKFLYRRLPTGQGVGVLAVTTAALLAAGPAAANLRAADSTNANNLWNQGLTGAGVTVGVWEAGSIWEVRNTHEAFTGLNGTGTRVLTAAGQGGGGFSDHATHVAGTIGGAHLGSDSLSRSRWGMAPGVFILSYDSANHTNEMISNPYIDISNHSYGPIVSESWDIRTWDVSDGSGGTVALNYHTWIYDEWDEANEQRDFGRYSYDTRLIDLALVQRPKLLSVWGAGNYRDNLFAPGAPHRYEDFQGDGRFVTQFSQSYIDNNTIIGEDLGNRYYLVHIDDYPAGMDSVGYDSLADYQVAKNTVVVGSVLDYTSDPHRNYGGYIATSSFSSYGPTDDGRLGVDLVANGDNVYSASSASNTAYVNRSGTSMAAPNASGTAALILEHWRNENGGYTPDSATQKGLLMHTATDATAYGVGPDYATGYGLINATEAVGHITESIYGSDATRDRHAWEDTLQDGETLTIDLIATGVPFKASLSWLDPAADTGSGVDDRTPKLVNDLDIWVVSNSVAQGGVITNTTYLPWVLDPEDPGAAATRDGHNRVDNFTQVFVESFAAGTELTLHIDHFGALTGGSQDYALFVTGATLDSDIDLFPVPEPGSLALLGLSGLLVLRRRRG